MNSTIVWEKTSIHFYRWKEMDNRWLMRNKILITSSNFSFDLASKVDYFYIFTFSYSFNRSIYLTFLIDNSLIEDKLLEINK